MKEELISLINEFGNLLTQSEFNQYIPKLKKYFVQFILETKPTEPSLENLFIEFRRSDIIDATIYYLKTNENVESLSAIDDNLIALNRLFIELVFNRYHNPTLEASRPFTELYNEVKTRIIQEGIDLKQREVDPAVDTDQYKFIVEYLKHLHRENLKSRQIKIIIKLLLLYGFSFDRLSGFLISDYNPTQRILEVKYEKSLHRKITIELPYTVDFEIKEYLQRRPNTNDGDLLFITQNNTKIKHAFIKDILDKIKNSFVEKEGELEGKNPFTSTGLQKYAIINMILKGMNQSIITDLTGQQKNIYDDCQNKVNDVKELNRNRYVNYKIRGIDTYDDI